MTNDKADKSSSHLPMPLAVYCLTCENYKASCDKQQLEEGRFVWAPGLRASISQGRQGRRSMRLLLKCSQARAQSPVIALKWLPLCLEPQPQSGCVFPPQLISRGNTIRCPRPTVRPIKLTTRLHLCCTYKALLWNSFYGQMQGEKYVSLCCRTRGLQPAQLD